MLEAFNKASKETLPGACRLEGIRVSYVPPYKNTLFLSIRHRPGMDSDTIRRAVLKVRESLFGGRRGEVVVARTVTDLIVTFPLGTTLSGSTPMEASRITTLLGIERASHPSKWLDDYRGEGAALRIPVTTNSLKSLNRHLPFREKDLTTQLYNREGDRAKYRDRAGYTVTLTRQSKSPPPKKRWAPSRFCLSGGHEKDRCWKKRNSKIMALCNPEAPRPWHSSRRPGRQGIPPPLPSPQGSLTTSPPHRVPRTNN